MARIGLGTIPDRDWYQYPILVNRDPEIPLRAKSTAITLMAMCDRSRRVMISRSESQKITGGCSTRTFRNHLKILRDRNVLCTMRTKNGTLVEFYSPWIRYTKIHYKSSNTYAIEPNSWISPILSEKMHMLGILPGDIKKWPKEDQTTQAISDRLTREATELIDKDLGEQGYAAIPSMKHQGGVFHLLMVKNRKLETRLDNSYITGEPVTFYDPKEQKFKTLNYRMPERIPATVMQMPKTDLKTPRIIEQESYAFGYQEGAKRVYTSVYGQLKGTEQAQYYRPEYVVPTPDILQEGAELDFSGTFKIPSKAEALDYAVNMACEEVNRIMLDEYEYPSEHGFHSLSRFFDTEYTDTMAYYVVPEPTYEAGCNFDYEDALEAQTLDADQEPAGVELQDQDSSEEESIQDSTGQVSADFAASLWIDGDITEVASFFDFKTGGKKLPIIYIVNYIEDIDNLNRLSSYSIKNHRSTYNFSGGVFNHRGEYKDQGEFELIELLLGTIKDTYPCFKNDTKIDSLQEVEIVIDSSMGNNSLDSLSVPTSFSALGVRQQSPEVIQNVSDSGLSGCHDRGYVVKNTPEYPKKMPWGKGFLINGKFSPVCPVSSETETVSNTLPDWMGIGGQLPRCAFEDGVVEVPLERSSYLSSRLTTLMGSERSPRARMGSLEAMSVEDQIEFWSKKENQRDYRHYPKGILDQIKAETKEAYQQALAERELMFRQYVTEDWDRFLDRLHTSAKKVNVAYRNNLIDQHIEYGLDKNKIKVYTVDETFQWLLKKALDERGIRSFRKDANGHYEFEPTVPGTEFNRFQLCFNAQDPQVGSGKDHNGARNTDQRA